LPSGLAQGARLPPGATSLLLLLLFPYDSVCSASSRNGDIGKLTKIAGSLFERGNEELIRTFVHLLVVALITDEEKQLVAIPVEVRPGQENGPPMLPPG
jgi:hypothetical protein